MLKSFYHLKNTDSEISERFSDVLFPQERVSHPEALEDV